MGSSPNNSRKVRFSLAGNEVIPPPQFVVNLRSAQRSPSLDRSPQFVTDKLKVHGTSTYINGTLLCADEPIIDVSKITPKTLPKIEPITLKPCIKEPTRRSNSYSRIPNVTTNETAGISRKSSVSINSNTSQVSPRESPERFVQRFRKSTAVIFSPSKYVRNFRSKSTPKSSQRKKLIPDLLKLPDLLKVHGQHHHRYTDTDVIVDEYDDEDEILLENTFKLNRFTESSSLDEIQEDCRKIPNMEHILLSREQNYTNVKSMADRLHLVQKPLLKTNNHFHFGKFMRKSSTEKETKLPSMSRFIKSSNPATTKYKTRIMSLQKVPLVPTLLRASRDADQELLTHVFTDIVSNGISREDLNANDNSGRTALSYICSTNLTDILELFLQLPAIDVNKADNEGNTPLHFAAQAGQSDIMNMLITKSRSLNIDAKNNMGLTPLMKAALQGRTKCAKLLLFAGASPVEVDSGRGMRADEWSRLCGRYSCAEMIEQCSRARLLENSTASKWTRDVIANEKTKTSKTKSNISNGGSLRSKFGRVFPFKLPFKNSKSTTLITKNGSEVNASKFISHSQDGFSEILTNEKYKSNYNSNCAFASVPKLEVTLANNKSLVKKYEEFSINDDNNYHFDDSTTVALNRKICK